jgi:hypothetical protein
MFEFSLFLLTQRCVYTYKINRKCIIYFATSQIICAENC